jgi:hypothetical protein
MRALITYQATDAPENIWRGWYSDDDTEDTLEGRPRRVLGIVGSWHGLSFWRDHEGIRIVMASKRKEVFLRYRIGDEVEVQEMLVGENEMPAQVILKARKQGSFYVTDLNDILFAKEDGLFGYATFPVFLPSKSNTVPAWKP